MIKTLCPQITQMTQILKPKDLIFLICAICVICG